MVKTVMMKISGMKMIMMMMMIIKIIMIIDNGNNDRQCTAFAMVKTTRRSMKMIIKTIIQPAREARGPEGPAR